MNKAPRLLLFIALIVVLAACGRFGVGNDPGIQALEATPTTTVAQPSPLPDTPTTAVEPAPTSTAAPTLEPIAAATSAVTPEATGTTPPTDVPPTETPAPTATEPAPTTSPPTSTNDVQRITATEAKSLMDSGEAVLYDTRSPAAYNAAHAAGALSFPEGDAAARIGDLPADKSLVFY